MPMSGEMRLRQIMLALIALSGVWIAVLIQRTHHAPLSAIAAGAPAISSPKIVHVPGLKRPASVTPIVRPTPRRHAAIPAAAPARPAQRPQADATARTPAD